VLHHRVASTISRVSTATRFSLRCSALVIEAFFETAKYSTSASLSIGRNILISALSSARNINFVNESPYETILDRYTNLGIYFVHHSFTLAELFSLTTFHLTSSTIKFSLKAAEETVRVIDGLFGSTETSRALSAIVEIVKRELYEEHEGFLHNHTSKLSLLGGVTKAITAFACLQKRTRRRQHQRLQLEPIAEYTPTVSQPKHIYPRQPLSANLARFVKFATGAYGKRFMRIFGIGRHVPSVIGDIHHANHHSFAGHTDIPVHCILLSSFQPPSPSSFLFESYLASSGISGQSNVHYLAVDHKSRAIVLTLRGTLGLSDVLTDLTCDYADIEVFVPKVDEDGKVVGKRRRIFQCHEGMLKQAQMMANEIGRYVKRALEEYDEYGLLLCGHSLGGAVASLLALLWSDRFNDPEDSVSDSFVDLASENELIDEDVFLDAQLHRISASSGLPKGRPLHCYAFGSPSVISHELSQLSSTLVTTVIHGMDLVPSLSLGLVKDLKLIAKTLTDERNKGVAEKVITKVLETEIDPEYYWNNSASMDSLEEDWFWSLIQTLRAECTSEKLYPAGSIYWVRDNNFTKLTDVASLTGELKFSRTMFTDHAPRFYEDALKGV
ncbi:hypothetical protein BKA69DRAFT_1021469, partial [Paraphysoderma sedebokerense]